MRTHRTRAARGASRLVRGFLVVSLAAVAAACGGDDAQSDVPYRIQFLPTSVKGIEVLEGDRPVAWARDISHQTAVAYELCPLEGCLEVTLIGLAGDAGDVAAVGDRLWVAPRRSDDTVRVVDPRGADTVSVPPLGASGVVAQAGDFVFVAAGTDLYRFVADDPLAEPEVLPWSADTQFAGEVVATTDTVWVIGHAGEVARVDAVTLEVTARGSVDGEIETAGSAAIGPDGLYIATARIGVDTLARLDPDTLDVTASIDFDEDVTTAAVTVDGDRVLAAASAELLELDPVTLEEVSAQQVPIGVAVDMAVVDGRVWIVTPASVIVVDQ